MDIAHRVTRSQLWLALPFLRSPPGAFCAPTCAASPMVQAANFPDGNDTSCHTGSGFLALAS